MSKKVSSESVIALGAVQNGPREIALWQDGVRNFFGETLAELRDLIKAIESHVQHESTSQSETGFEISSESADAQPSFVASTGYFRAEAREDGRATRSLELIDAGRKHKEPITTLKPQDAATGPGNSEQRLAQLARRLEEKLERSSSREND